MNLSCVQVPDIWDLAPLEKKKTLNWENDDEPLDGMRCQQQAFLWHPFSCLIIAVAGGFTQTKTSQLGRSSQQETKKK